MSAPKPPHQSDLREWRCRKCNRKLMCLSANITGAIEVVCPKCKTVHYREIDQGQAA